MKTYTVEVYDNGDKYWRLDGKLHREDGPAIEYSNGDKFWWLDGKYLNEEEHALQTSQCPRKTVVIDGIEYELVKK